MAIGESQACTYSSIPTVGDQIVASSQQVTIAAMTSSGCPALTYQIKTSPLSLPGGASVTFTGSPPSIQVNQGTNVDSFAVSVSQESAGQVYAYTAFLVHPVDSSDPTSPDFVAFCTANSASCLCTSTCAASSTDFCGTDFHLFPTAQPTGQEFLIVNPAVPETYSLNPFTLQSAQPDYGCDQTSYSILIEDPNSPGSFISNSDVALDPSTLELTLGLTDATFAGDTNLRLIFNGQNYADFSVSMCSFTLPTNHFSDPAQVLAFLVQDSQTDILFSAYDTYAGTSLCSGYTSTVDIAGIDSGWMTFDATPSTPKLTLDPANSGVVDTQDFSLTFEVTDHNGNVVVSEAFTITINNCASLTASGLLHDVAGTAISGGTQANTYDWNLSTQTSYTLQIVPATHNDALCGALNSQQVVVDDPLQTYTTYTTTTAGPPVTLTFDLSLRTMTSNDETITVTVTDTNSHGATTSQIVTLNLHLCAQAPPPGSSPFTCHFYMNLGTGSCVFPENTNMHLSCLPLDFEIEDPIGGGIFKSVSGGSVTWASSTGDPTTHTLNLDFSGYTVAQMDALKGYYSARRTQSTVIETFTLSLCYFTEPTSVYVTPLPASGTFQYNRSANSGASTVYAIQLEPYELTTTITGCQNYGAFLDNAETWTQLALNPGGIVYHELQATVDSTTPVGQVTVTYRVTSDDGTFEKTHDITISIVDCSLGGHTHGTDLVTDFVGTAQTTFYQNYQTVKKYYHKEFYYGEDTICGPITYTLATSPDYTAGVAGQTISYTTSVFGTREISVDLSSVIFADFINTVTVTIQADNTDQLVTSTETFILQIRDCRQEDMTLIPASPTIFVLADTAVVHSFDSSQITTTDTACYPLTISIAVEDSTTGSWSLVETGVFDPNWITSISQVNSGAGPFSYSFTFSLPENNPMPSYNVKTYVTNVRGGPIVKESAVFEVHFFARVLASPMWANPASLTSGTSLVEFTKLQTSPSLIETNYLYSTYNPLVELSVAYIDYDTSIAGLYTEETATNYNLRVDLSLTPIPVTISGVLTPYSDVITRQVTVSKVSDSADSAIVTEEQTDFTLFLYDCDYDFVPPADNLELVQGEETNLSFQSPKFRYQIGTGSSVGTTTYSLPILLPSQLWEPQCGPIQIDLATTPTVSYITFSSTATELVIDTSVATAVTDLTVQVTLKNNDFLAPLHAPLEIQLFNCDDPLLVGTPIDVSETLLAGDTSAPTTTWVWDPMTFTDSFCVLQLYTVTCTDPDGASAVINDNTAATAFSGPKCDIFSVDTTHAVRQISIPDMTVVTNAHEGVYVIRVEGTNSLSPSNPIVYTLTVTVEPNCSIATITPPNLELTNVGDPAPYLPYIGINVFETDEWVLSQFQLSTTTVCEMSFHFLHSPDGTDAGFYEADLTTPTALPDYISMTPSSGGTVQPLTIKIDGAFTSNAQFTGENVKILFAVEARIVGSVPEVKSMVKFEVIFFPDCTENQVKIQDTIVLQPPKIVQLGRITDTLVLSSVDTDLTKAVITNKNDDPVQSVHDNAACRILNSDHSLVVMAQTTDILSLSTVNQETVTDDLFQITTRVNIVNQDVDLIAQPIDPTEVCYLATQGTPECTITYQIQVTSYNTTAVWTLAEGQVTFVSECLSLQSIYEAQGDTNLWEWSDKTLFDAGYALRQAAVNFELPRVKSALTYGQAVFDECGSYRITVTNPDTEVFTIDQSTITLDNSDYIGVTAWTETTNKILPYTSVFQDYPFQIQVELELFIGHPDTVTYYYYQESPLDSARKSELTFVLRDYCRTPTFTLSSMIIPDNSTLTDFQTEADPAQELMLEKKILSDPTDFILTYLDYTTAEVGIDYLCGPKEAIIYETLPVDASDEIFADVVTQSPNPQNWLTEDGLRYTMQPISNEQASGVYYFRVKATLGEPADAFGSDAVGSTTIEVKIRIRPCEVLAITQGNQVFQNHNLMINVDQAVETFYDFVQVPACNLTMSYNVTVLENSEEFSDSKIGRRLDPPIVTFDPTNTELKSIELYSTNVAYDTKVFTVFVTGHADVDPDIQGPIHGTSNGFNVEFFLTPPDPPPTKPIIVLFTKGFVIEAGNSKTFFVGEAQDYLNRPVAVTWKFVGPAYEYMTVNDSAEGARLEFKVFPPDTSLDKLIKMELELNVEGADPPLIQTYVIEITVQEKAEQDESSFVPVQEDDSVSDTEVKEVLSDIKVSEIDKTGQMQIRFTGDIYWPDDIVNWSSTNIGAEFFKFSFQPSGESLDYFENTKTWVDMSWNIAKRTKNVLTIQFKFSKPELVSKFFRKGHVDFVKVELEDKWDTDLNIQVLNKEEKHRARVIPQESKQSIKLSIQSVSLAEGSVATMVSANLATSILSSQVIQLLWGVINSLQLIVLPVLYSLMFPPVTFDVLISIMKMTNLDLIDMEPVLMTMFQFTETEPVNLTFEAAGYDTSNFFIELGPLFFMMLLFGFWMPIRLCIRNCGTNINSNNCLTRRMRRNPKFVPTIVRFLIEGTTEICLAVLICISQINSDKFEKAWDGFSTVSSFLAAFVFLGLPFFMQREKRLLLTEPNKEFAEEEYGVLFPDLIRNPSALNFQILFFVRRYILVACVCLPPRNEISQSLVHIAASLGQAAYLLSVRPFESSSKNWQEKVNEVGVLVTSYHLIVFSNWIIDDKAAKMAGFSLLGFIVLIVFFNICVILVLMIKGFILKCKIRKARKAQKQRLKAFKELVQRRSVVDQKRLAAEKLKAEKIEKMKALKEANAAKEQEKQQIVEAKLRQLPREEKKPKVLDGLNDLEQMLQDENQLIEEDKKIVIGLSPIKLDLFLPKNSKKNEEEYNRVKQQMQNFERSLLQRNTPIMKERATNKDAKSEISRLNVPRQPSLTKTTSFRDNFHPTLGQGMAQTAKIKSRPEIQHMSATNMSHNNIVPTGEDISSMHAVSQREPSQTDKNEFVGLSSINMDLFDLKALASKPQQASLLQRSNQSSMSLMPSSLPKPQQRQLQSVLRDEARARNINNQQQLQSIDSVKSENSAMFDQRRQTQQPPAPQARRPLFQLTPAKAFNLDTFPELVQSSNRVALQPFSASDLNFERRGNSLSPVRQHFE